MTQIPCQEPSCWGAMCNDGATKSPRASIRGLRRLRSFLSFENRPENIHFSAWNQSRNTWKLRTAC